MRTVHATKHEQNLIEHSFGNDDAYNGNIDDTLDSATEVSHMDPVSISNRRRLQRNNYDVSLLDYACRTRALQFN